VHIAAAQIGEYDLERVCRTVVVVVVDGTVSVVIRLDAVESDCDLTVDGIKIPIDLPALIDIEV